jgi:type IV pilus assembly protein PilW
MSNPQSRNMMRGFSLVELMVVLVLTSMSAAAIYRVFVSFSTSYDIQDQVTELQQNLRVGMPKMIRDIRMAGYDPNEIGGIGFTTMSTNTIIFGYGSTTVGYTIADLPVSDPDGMMDLGRSTDGGATYSSIIENIEALNFVYLDSAGAVTAGTDVRSVQIAMVVKATSESYGYTNNETYSNLQGTQVLGAQADNFRRRLLTSQVKCRNMGL